MRSLRVLALTLVVGLTCLAPAFASPAMKMVAHAKYPKVVAGIYVDRLSGTPASGPHYFFLMHVKGSKVHGDLEFEGQDGSVEIVHTFKGSQQFGLITLHFSGHAHKRLTAEIGNAKHFELENCHAVMRFASARFPDCQFHKAAKFSD